MVKNTNYKNTFPLKQFLESFLILLVHAIAVMLYTPTAVFSYISSRILPLEISACSPDNSCNGFFQTLVSLPSLDRECHILTTYNLRQRDKGYENQFETITHHINLSSISRYTILTNISIWVSSVEAVSIIEVDSDPECLLGALCPFQNLLCPIHTQETMEFTFRHKLLLENKTQRNKC